ncbi:hypothetical protein ACI0YW_004025 [Cronobacter sakazakii]
MSLNQINNLVVKAATQNLGNPLKAIYLVGSQAQVGSGRDFDYVFVFEDTVYELACRYGSDEWAKTHKALETLLKHWLPHEGINQHVKFDFISMSESRLTHDLALANAALPSSGLLDVIFDKASGFNFFGQHGFVGVIAHHGIRIYPQ